MGLNENETIQSNSINGVQFTEIQTELMFLMPSELNSLEYHRMGSTLFRSPEYNLSDSILRYPSHLTQPILEGITNKTKVSG